MSLVPSNRARLAVCSRGPGGVRAGADGSGRWRRCLRAARYRRDGADARCSAGIADGDLNVVWMHGSASCNTNQDPEVQVHAYNATTHILRQNTCDTFEAPFAYVLIGSDRALLLDSGDTTSTTLRTTVQGLLGGKPLLVAHTHAHGDHTRGDVTFAGQPSTTVVAKSISAIQQTFQIATWPTSQG